MLMKQNTLKKAYKRLFEKEWRAGRRKVVAVVEGLD